MDLAIGAWRVFVMITLFTRGGASKLVPRCTYPLTGVGCVSRVYADYAICDITREGPGINQAFVISPAKLVKRLALPDLAA
jgi:3-oxoadipate CoA-transferase beta subunit